MLVEFSLFIIHILIVLYLFDEYCFDAFFGVAENNGLWWCWKWWYGFEQCIFNITSHCQKIFLHRRLERHTCIPFMSVVNNNIVRRALSSTFKMEIWSVSFSTYAKKIWYSIILLNIERYIWDLLFLTQYFAGSTTRNTRGRGGWGQGRGWWSAPVAYRPMLREMDKLPPGFI